MIFDQFTKLNKLGLDYYVPSMKWRMAEYTSVRELKEDVKDKIVPLFTIPPIEWDFEKNRISKTTQQHVEDFPNRFHDNWGDRPAWIALDKDIKKTRMEDKSHVYDYIYRHLPYYLKTLIPVMTLDTDSMTLGVVTDICDNSKMGYGVLIYPKDLMSVNFNKNIQSILARTNTSIQNVDLIIDLETPNYTPYSTFSKVLTNNIKKLARLDGFRNFVMISSAYPSNFSKIKKDVVKVARHDWRFYKHFVERLHEDIRVPIYGDCTVVHPIQFRAMNKKFLNPRAKLVYTQTNHWIIKFGSPFYPDPSQMFIHCREIVNQPQYGFKGSSYSYGDSYISDCSEGIAGPGNLTVWKKVAINHHITCVNHDISNLYD